MAFSLDGAVLFLFRDGMANATNVSANLVVSSGGWPDIHGRYPTLTGHPSEGFHGLRRCPCFLFLWRMVDVP